ncbi:MAG: DNA gyrase subunit A [Anaerolineae bacterium]|nr:DNA gyrase subunit A [Thermoflexales bacterium]MDW8407847.1 DNA gyrase subunit A [Anaerolineae bacterium]
MTSDNLISDPPSNTNGPGSEAVWSPETPSSAHASAHPEHIAAPIDGESFSENLNAALGRVREIDINHEMRGAYLDYAMSVIVSRALPDARDGLKPVQRRILYVMHDTGARANAPYRKSARVVGDVLGKYHPHGDQSVYDAMARLAQDFAIRYPLVDGQGNFGSIDGDPPAAMRYTEARLSRIAEELLTDLDKDTVDWSDNFDGTLQEPTVLPASLPHLLLNGASGIAVGMATNIPPHNLRELCQAVTLLIDRWDDIDNVSVEDLMRVVPGPDFPTGALIIGREGIQSAYATGHGRLVMRGVARIEELRGGRNQIIITELPYQVNKALLIERIAELAREGRIEEISDLRDESDRRGMRIVIELRRGAQPNRVLNRLYKFTALQTTFGAQFLALVDGQPRVIGLKRALLIFIEHRREVIRRRSEFELGKARARAHILEGLRIAIQFLDEVIRIIRTAPDAEAAKAGLIERFALSDAQAQAILDMPLRRLAALERQKLEDEYQAVLATIAYLEDLLANPHKVLGLIREEMTQMAERYGDERRTRIVLDARETFAEEELIPNKAVLISITQRGYIKQTAADAYRAQSRGGRGVAGMQTADQDEVIFLLSAHSHDTILFFSNRGKVYALRAYQIPEADRAGKGTFVSNLISIGDSERITSALAVPHDLLAAAAVSPNGEEDADTEEEIEAEVTEDNGSVEAGDELAEEDEDAGDVDQAPPAAPCIALCTRKGRIKRVALRHFANIRSTGLICMSLLPDDELSYARLTPGNGDLILVTAQGQALRFRETLVREMGRSAGGVRAMRLKKEGDYIAGMEVAEPGGALLTVTEKGFGKRTPLEEYSVKGRGGGGMRTMTSDLEQTGLLVAARVVQPTDQITLISASGVVLRQRVSEIPQSGRTTRGLRLMKLRDGDSVASVARLAEVQ